MAVKADLTRVSIFGCGWYGLELAKTLIKEGYQVKGSTTSDQKVSVLATLGIKPYLITTEEFVPLNVQDFFDTDILIICIPPKRNSAEVTSYEEKIGKIAAAASMVKHVLFISATSVYRDADGIVTEETGTNPHTLSAIQLLKAEEQLKKNTRFTTTVLRFSGLVGPGRHPGRFFAGKKNIPNGKAPVNLVHLDDCTQLTLEIINGAFFGKTYNVSGPHHPEKQLFYTTAAKKLGLEIPEFRDELNEWKIISSSNIPDLIHYHYKISNWMKWLDDNIN